MISYPQSLEQRHLVNFQLTGEAWYNRNYKTLSLKKKSSQRYHPALPIPESPQGTQYSQRRGWYSRPIKPEPPQVGPLISVFQSSAGEYNLQASLRTTLQEKDS